MIHYFIFYTSNMSYKHTGTQLRSTKTISLPIEREPNQKRKKKEKEEERFTSLTINDHLFIICAALSELHAEVEELSPYEEHANKTAKAQKRSAAES